MAAERIEAATHRAIVPSMNSESEGGSRLNLTAVLCVAATADLVLHRLIERLFLPQHPVGIAAVAALVGRFAFNLSSVLGWALVAVTFFTALRRGDLFRGFMRLSVGVVALFFVAAAAVGVFFASLPDPYLIPLKGTHALLAWFIVLATWRGPSSLRGKIGLTLFAVPPILHAIALFWDRVGWARGLPTELARIAEICALVAGALAPLLLAPEPATGRRGLAGALVGVLTLSVMLVALVLRFDLVQMLALYGFRIDVPQLTTPGAVTYDALVIAAFVGIAMAIVWTMAERGGPRLVGYGLVLVTVAGHQALAPNQVLLATCGLLALAHGLIKSREPREPAATPALTEVSAAAGL